MYLLNHIINCAIFKEIRWNILEHDGMIQIQLIGKVGERIQTLNENQFNNRMLEIIFRRYWSIIY